MVIMTDCQSVDVGSIPTNRSNNLIDEREL